MSKNIFVISLFLCIFTLAAKAQNLDPTVEVSREYEGKLVEVHKPVFEMAVPDSVTRFALDFDYSVFENPYKGSYEFSPYLLSMKPSASDSGENRFYLRAGAGYQLQPTLDMVWSPDFGRKDFNMDVYALHRSFFGNYYTIEPDDPASREVVFTKVPSSGKGYQYWSGYDMMNKAGVDFKHDWEALSLEYSAGYHGMSQKVPRWQRNYNALDAGFGISTKPESNESMAFDMDVDYRLGEDVVGGSKLKENIGGVSLQIGPFWLENRRMSLDLDVNYASYSGAFKLVGGDVSVTPRYVVVKDRLIADFGVKIAKMITASDLKEQYVYPDVNFTYALLPKSLKFYFKAGGGGEFETYSSTIASNHHVTHLLSSDMLGYKIERVHLTAGFDGRVTDAFSYNLRGGYANYSSLRHYVACVIEQPYTMMMYFGAQKWFAAVDWALDIEGFRFDGTVSYDRYWDKDGEYDGGLAISRFALLKPAALTGEISVEYNWKKRLVLGADCDFSGAMRGCYWVDQPGLNSVVVVPGYADLGLYAEYATARNLSLWIRAGNLLNQTIQRTPLYAEKGVKFTLGICMNL